MLQISLDYKFSSYIKSHENRTSSRVITIPFSLYIKILEEILWPSIFSHPKKIAVNKITTSYPRFKDSLSIIFIHTNPTAWNTRDFIPFSFPVIRSRNKRPMDPTCKRYHQLSIVPPPIILSGWPPRSRETFGFPGAG